MKRKTAAVLLAGAMAATMAGSSAQAMTYSWEGENGTVFYYIFDEEEGKPQEEKEEEKIREEKTGGEKTAEEKTQEEKTEEEKAREEKTEEEKKREEELWHKAEMQDSLSYLKEYGVTYDSEQDVIWYQGKKVRWLIDAQMDNGYKAFEMPDGEIDVYTVRDESFRLTGVRKATQEEFDERTLQDAWEDVLSENGITLTLGEEWNTAEAVGAGDGSIIYSIEEAVDAEADGSGPDESSREFWIEAVPDEPDLDISVEATETGDTVVREGEYLEETEEKRAEYKAAGIDCDDKTGSWIWEGKKVFWLVDEDGSMYQNGEGREDKVYILVKRNEDGSIKEAKQITAEEVMAERILRLEEETEF